MLHIHLSMIAQEEYIRIVHIFYGIHYVTQHLIHFCDHRIIDGARASNADFVQRMMPVLAKAHILHHRMLIHVLWRNGNRTFIDSGKITLVCNTAGVGYIHTHI